jgi:hypothetical protein
MIRKYNSTLQFISVFLVLIILSACNLFDNQISMKSLLLEMTNRETLAQFPEREFIVSQFSSYDRALKITDHYTWFAKQDNNYYIRTETNNGRREFVMFDSEGPGAFIRFWTTNRPDKRVEKKDVLRFQRRHRISGYCKIGIRCKTNLARNDS